MRLFREWPADKAPALALVLSAQENGYLQPCGCSHPQLGGLPRRYNFIQELKKRGWPVAAVDLGDLPDLAQHRGPQAMLKYEYSMHTLQAMDYAAVAVGPQEISISLMDALVAFALQPKNSSPRILAANLQNKKEDFLDGIGSWKITGGQGGAEGRRRRHGGPQRGRQRPGTAEPAHPLRP